MYTIFGIVLLFIATPTVFAQNEQLCQFEFERIFREAQNCNPGNGYSIFDIEPTYDRESAGLISKYQLRRYIRNTCRTALNDTQCTRNIHVAEECQSLPQIQLFSNLIIIMTTQVDYLCSVAPGQSHVRYLDWVKKDGPSCSASNKGVDACLSEGKRRLGITDDNNSLTANVCTMIEIQNECSNLYLLCKNKTVYKYMTEISQILSELYNC